MKKIIRIASVIALASASLLYVGCTKDFSADIAKTNQDVAALNQKIETLNSTVQTINSTVENLKTTKADLSTVNALGDKVTAAEGKITTLGGKIDDLDGKLTSTKTDLTAAIATAKHEAIDAASADAATKLAAAKTELEGVINGVKAKVDSLEAFTVAQTDSLRKDVDSLYANYEALEARIAALEGKVVDLAARVSSIVAVPSMNKEFRHFNISNVDTTFFAATFAVTPKAAVEKIGEDDLTVSFKEGLTRDAAEAVDTTFKASKVVADKEAGKITVFVGLKATLSAAESNALYYSLQFAGEDKAGKYEENSEYVKAHSDVDLISTSNAVIVKGGAELTADPALEDTLAFDGSEGTKFASLFSGLDVAFKFNDELISKEDIAELLDTNFVVVPADSLISARYDGSIHTPYVVNDSTAGIVVTRDKGTNLCSEKEDVGNWVQISISGVKINGAAVYSGFSITEKHWVGAKTVEYTLPAVSEPWTYTSWDKVTRTVSIANCKEIRKVIPDAGIIASNFTNFTVKSNSDTTGVNIEVKDAQRITKAAKDTVFNVVFKQIANIVAGDSVNFSINWKYTLEARPADKTIALANIDTTATDYTKEIKLAVDKDINKLTFAAFDAAYDKVIDSAYVNTNIESATVVLDSVAFDGKKVSSAKVENGAVVLPAFSKAGAYSVILNKTVFGIKYTYTYTINLAWKEALKLHATPYVSAGVAVVDADTTVSPYTLKAMDMAKYLQVYNADTLAKGFSGYEVVFHYELEDSVKFKNADKSVVINKVDFDTTALAVTNGVLGSRKLDWKDYNGREVEITAYLVNSKDTVDTYTFTLKYNKPVTSFAAGTQTIKRVAGQNAEAVLSKSFNITGIYNGNKNLIVDTTGAWVNGKNYYDCKIAYDFDEAIFKVDGVETSFAEDVDYKVEGLTGNSPADAKITFIGDNNNKPIEASIPVVLTYKYDYNHVEAYKDNVVIKVVNE